MLRRVIEHPQFAHEKYQLHSDAKLVDDLLRDVVIFPLSRQPEIGKPTAASAVWAFVVHFGPYREYVVYYAFNDEAVTLLGIRKARNDVEDFYGA